MITIELYILVFLFWITTFVSAHQFEYFTKNELFFIGLFWRVVHLWYHSLGNHKKLNPELNLFNYHSPISTYCHNPVTDRKPLCKATVLLYVVIPFRIYQWTVIVAVREPTNLCVLPNLKVPIFYKHIIRQYTCSMTCLQ